MSAPVRIAMWSGPRNISTAMMRSFSSRADCAVTDEPFYGCYLRQSGERQPMADEVMASMDCDWNSVKTAMRGSVPGNKTVWYQKHMPHHMIGDIDISDFPEHIHCFLIRDPRLVVASYAVKGIAVTPDHLGLARQTLYFKQEADRLGHAPPVVDSNDILADPAAILSQLCAAIGITWDDAMLHWPMGRHPSDGIWASHWYAAVENSTGFGQPTAISPLSADQQAVADQCWADYEFLAQHKIGT
ncbi:HAD family hydrolase [Sphingorhabdus arenilitoris]|uniref:HAD family hydrolase n=1 Tax=Sphingorhabdus arenilitoris TaxID=1490041 RepID=A0ABV8RFE2_9SPHN